MESPFPDPQIPLCSFTDVMLLLCPLLSGYQTNVRRRGREAEGTRLLNERAPKGHRGFESLRLRQFVFYVIEVKDFFE